MNTSILIVGIVITALFVVPFIFAFRHGRGRRVWARKVMGDEARKNHLKVAKLEVFGRGGMVFDSQKSALMWCEFDGPAVTACRLISLADVADCHVLVNNQFLSGNRDSNHAVASVRLRLILTRGDQMQETFGLFDARIDDPLGADDAIGAARKWSRIVKSSIGR